MARLRIFQWISFLFIVFLIAYCYCCCSDNNQQVSFVNPTTTYIPNPPTPTIPPSPTPTAIGITFAKFLDRGYGTDIIEKENQQGFFLLANNKSLDTIEIISLSHLGEIEWTKSMRFSERDYGGAIVSDREGNYIIAGSMQPDDDANNRDVLIFKIDKEANVLWNMTTGGQFEDSAYTIKETSDEEYVVFGGSRSFSEDQTMQFFAVKFDADGVIDWSKNYEQPNSTIDNYGTKIVDLANNFLCLGYGILCVDDEFDTLWSNDLFYDFRGGGIIWNNENRFYVVGMAYIPYDNGHYEAGVFKEFDTNGIFQGWYYWREYIFLDSIPLDNSTAVVLGGTPRLYAHGYPGNQIYLFKFHKTNRLWTKEYGAESRHEKMYSLIGTSDSGYIAVGTSYNYYHANPHIIVLKVDEYGNCISNFE